MTATKQGSDIPWIGWSSIRDSTLRNARNTLDMKIWQERPVIGRMAAAGAHLATHTAQMLIPVLAIYQATDRQVLPAAIAYVGAYLFRTGYDLGRASNDE